MLWFLRDGVSRNARWKFFSKAGGAACHDAFIVKDEVRHGEDEAVVPMLTCAKSFLAESLATV